MVDCTIMTYKEGSHFKKHVDTKRGEGHLGTLLAIVPADAGGTLRVFDGVWSRDGRTAGPNEPRLVWMALGVPHEVTPVTSGSRWVLKAAVFGEFNLQEPFVFDWKPQRYITWAGPADGGPWESEYEDHQYLDHSSEHSSW